MDITSAHFGDAELRCHGTSCGPLRTGCKVNGCTQALVDALEALRGAADKAWVQRFGEQVFPGVTVDDAYRCPIHNSSTPNAAISSQHVLGNAADIRIPGMAAAQLELIARTIPAIQGIGRADIQNYLHIDVRPNPAQWCYAASGATEKYFKLG
jgi:hypothetical protein